MATEAKVHEAMRLARMAQEQQPDMTPHEQSDSLLMALPPEIRTFIWELVLYVQKDSESRTHISYTTRSYALEESRSALRLLGTCRQINQEAAGIFYNVNDITISSRLLRPRNAPRIQNHEDAAVLLRSPQRNPQGFLEVLSPRRLAGLRDVKIHCWNIAEVVDTLGYLEGQCPRLQRLSLVVIKVYTAERFIDAIKMAIPFFKQRVPRLGQVRELSLHKSGPYLYKDEMEAWEELSKKMTACLPRSQNISKTEV